MHAKKFVTCTSAIRRMEGAGSHWRHMAKIMSQQPNRTF